MIRIYPEADHRKGVLHGERHLSGFTITTVFIAGFHRSTLIGIHIVHLSGGCENLIFCTGLTVRIVSGLKVDLGVSVSALPRKYRDIDRGIISVFATRISGLQRSTATLKFTITTRLIRRIMRIDRSLFRRKIDFIGRAAIAPFRRVVSVHPIVIRCLIRRCAVGIHRDAS